MVKTKREIITPAKRACLSKKQKIFDSNVTKVLSRPNSANIQERNSTANIKVIVRVRPPNSKEQCENYRPVVKVVEDDMLIFDPEEETQGFFFHGVQQKGRDLLKKAKKNMKFHFDRIFPPNSTNYEIFQGTTFSLIDNIMDGYNCSVFAYGATGAGKTFTMTGTSDKPGITFLTMTELFKKQEELKNEREFEIGITYLEVYNELVKDLLNPGAPLNLREDSNFGVIVAGIKFFKINKSEQLFSLLEQGNINRTQHPTDANAESSRSHAVFQVYLKMTIKATNEIRTSKLSMIDLAGSERGSATGFAGARFTEGANINKSLLALGNCINSLADGHRHVPYRDSKLTRLLKDSLGGNCQTVMIANVSPSSLSFDDTYNTLKYATRASAIKANVHRNVSKVDSNIMKYVKLVEDLTKENQALKQEVQELKAERASVQVQARLPVKTETTVCPSVAEEINQLVKQKFDLLERQFHLEKSESSTAIKRLFKEEIDCRLSSVCTDTPERDQVRDKLNLTITRFKKQESALRGDIEKTEDITDDIDKKLDDLEMKHPECKQLIEIERRNLLLLRSKHRLLLERRYTESIVGELEDKTELVEKMAGTLRSWFKLLHAHGYASLTMVKQYKDIIQTLQGKQNAKWSELPDSGISSMSSVQDDEDRKLLGKRKLEMPLNQTFLAAENAESDKQKPKKYAEPLMSSGSQNRSPAVPAKRLAVKSPRNKENIARMPFDTSKPTKSVRPMVNQRVAKGVLKVRPTPLANRPRFRR